MKAKRRSRHEGLTEQVAGADRPRPVALAVFHKIAFKDVYRLVGLGVPVGGDDRTWFHLGQDGHRPCGLVLVQHFHRHAGHTRSDHGN